MNLTPGSYQYYTMTLVDGPHEAWWLPVATWRIGYAHKVVRGSSKTDG
jgi:hypothetical protein